MTCRAEIGDDPEQRLDHCGDCAACDLVIKDDEKQKKKEAY